MTLLDGVTGPMRAPVKAWETPITTAMPVMFTVRPVNCSIMPPNSTSIMTTMMRGMPIIEPSSDGERNQRLRSRPAWTDTEPNQLILPRVRDRVLTPSS